MAFWACMVFTISLSLFIAHYDGMGHHGPEFNKVVSGICWGWFLGIPVDHFIGHGGHPKRGSDWCGLGARAS